MDPTDQEIIDIINDFFIRCMVLICSPDKSRFSINSENDQRYQDSWFALTSGDLLPQLPDNASTWSKFNGISALPPLVIETVLNIKSLTQKQTLKLKSSDGHIWTVCKGGKKSEVVLERWLVELDTECSQFKKADISAFGDTKAVRKQEILLFRYLNTLLELLPVNALYRNLMNNNRDKPNDPDIRIDMKILNGKDPIISKGRLGLSKPIIATYSNVLNESTVPAHLEQRKITPVWTKYGLLRVSVSYRKDCQFSLAYENDVNHNHLTPTVSNNESRRSFSVSPFSKENNSLINSQNSWGRKLSLTSKRIQPFKVESIGMGNSTSPPTSSVRSNSSVLSALQMQRQGNNYNSVTQQPLLPNSSSHVDSSSVGSNSRFMSSFSKLRRRSSSKPNDAIDPVLHTLRNSKRNSDEILEFVKSIDARPALSVSKPTPINDNASLCDSLIRYQRLKPSNDVLGEDLSMSLLMDSNNYHVNRRRSGSLSPMNSYTNHNIATRYLHSQYSVKGSSSGANSRRSSLDRQEIATKSPILGPKNSPNPVDQCILEEHQSDNNSRNSLCQASMPGFNFSPTANEVGPGQLYLQKSRFPYRQSYAYSKPTTTAVKAHANLHKPDIKHDGILRVSEDVLPAKPSQNELKDSGTYGQGHDEDDMVFFMSDMNLSK